MRVTQRYLDDTLTKPSLVGFLLQPWLRCTPTPTQEPWLYSHHQRKACGDLRPLHASFAHVVRPSPVVGAASWPAAWLRAMRTVPSMTRHLQTRTPRTEPHWSPASNFSYGGTPLPPIRVRTQEPRSRRLRLEIRTVLV